jgi:hypothetical protein
MPRHFVYAFLCVSACPLSPLAITTHYRSTLAVDFRIV